MESWRFFYDNLYDRPLKASFTGPSYGGATETAGHGWARAFDGTRGTTTRFTGMAASQVLTYSTTWTAPNRPVPVGGKWAFGLFNHNLKSAGALQIDIEASVGGFPAGTVLRVYFPATPTLTGPTPFEETRDPDYVWLSSVDTYSLPVDQLDIKIQWNTSAQTAEAFIGQFMVCSGYIDTEVGPVAPNQTRIESTRQLLRTASGDPSVNAGLGQSQPFNVEFPLVSAAARDQWTTLLAWQRNGFPYMLHPHAVPTDLLWTPPTDPGNEVQVEGRGGGWMATPNSGAGVLFNPMDRYTVRTAGIRQKGLYQWE